MRIMAEIKLGKYRHFKGGSYKVLGVAHHSETLEELVVYYSLDGSKLWVRPKSMFLEKVIVHGKEISRFEYVEKG